MLHFLSFSLLPVCYIFLRCLRVVADFGPMCNDLDAMLLWFCFSSIILVLDLQYSFFGSIWKRNIEVLVIDVSSFLYVIVGLSYIISDYFLTFCLYSSSRLYILQGPSELMPPVRFNSLLICEKL